MFLVYTSWHISNAMVKLQRVFVAVLPNLVQQPPLLWTCLLLWGGLWSKTPSLASLCKKEWAGKQQASQKRPHPEQGSEWISATWLQYISDQDCLWRFRYVLSSFVYARSWSRHKVTTQELFDMVDALNPPTLIKHQWATPLTLLKPSSWKILSGGSSF